MECKLSTNLTVAALSFRGESKSRPGLTLEFGRRTTSNGDACTGGEQGLSKGPT